jgi:hypothetical protein
LFNKEQLQPFIVPTSKYDSAELAFDSYDGKMSTPNSKISKIERESRKIAKYVKKHPEQNDEEGGVLNQTPGKGKKIVPIDENTTSVSAGEYNGPIELGLRKWIKSELDPFVNTLESEFNNKSKSKTLKGNRDTVVGMWEKGVDGKYDIDTEDVNTVKESEDKPMKKFNRDNNPDKGKYGKLIEDIALSYFRNPDDVCDIICIKTGPTHEGLGDYILLVLMSYSMSETKLSEYIKGFVPIDVMVLINTSYHCKDED